MSALYDLSRRPEWPHHLADPLPPRPPDGFGWRVWEQTASRPPRWGQGRV